VNVKQIKVLAYRECNVHLFRSRDFGIEFAKQDRDPGIDYIANALVTKGVKMKKKFIPTTVLLVHNAKLANFVD
jgi:hypothetical protein